MTTNEQARELRAAATRDQYAKLAAAMRLAFQHATLGMLRFNAAALRSQERSYAKRRRDMIDARLERKYRRQAEVAEAAVARLERKIASTS